MGRLMARSRTMVTSCSWAPTLAMTLCLFANESLATITNYIEVNGSVYATLGNAELNPSDHLGCESIWLEMPERWELVPWSDHEKVRDDVVSKYSFSTDCVILGNGGAICHRGSLKPSVHEKENNLQQNGTRYKVRDCVWGVGMARVLIRQGATTTTTTSATTTHTTTRTTAKLRKRVAMASKSLHAVLGWSTVLAPVMFWAWAP